MRALFPAFLIASSILFGADKIENYPVKDYKHLLGMQGFNDSLLQMHFKLYEGYVKNTNDLLYKIKTTKIDSYEYGALKRRLGWEFDGMRLHELYFENLGGDGVMGDCPISKAILAQFGTYEQWKKEFVGIGSMRGIGWAVLYFDPETKRLVNVWINEHDGGHLAMGVPVLVMDVFEHAYMPQYGLDKAGYIDAFFKNIYWKGACRRYCKAAGLLKEKPNLESENMLEVPK